ncbi:hypothetical protein FQZ97_1095770 [compost metagenome]
MPGRRIHTPTIIIRLDGESMRSQAVSTLLMRSPSSPKAPASVGAAFCGAGLARGWSGAATVGAALRVTRWTM